MTRCVDKYVKLLNNTDGFWQPNEVTWQPNEGISSFIINVNIVAITHHAMGTFLLYNYIAFKNGNVIKYISCFY